MIRLFAVLVLLTGSLSWAGASVAGPAHDVPALSNVSGDADAQAICKTTCRLIPEEWNGGWHAASPGNTGTCSCGTKPRPPSSGWGFSPANSNSARAAGESACSAPPSSQNGSCASCSISCSGDKHASCSQGQEWPGGSPTCMRDAKCECQ